MPFDSELRLRDSPPSLALSFSRLSHKQFQQVASLPIGTSRPAAGWARGGEKDLKEAQVAQDLLDAEGFKPLVRLAPKRDWQRLHQRLKRLPRRRHRLAHPAPLQQSLVVTGRSSQPHIPYQKASKGSFDDNSQICRHWQSPLQV